MSTAPAPRAGRREWIGLVALALPTVLLSMDLTVLHLAVPMISADLDPSAAQLLWITDIYGFTLAGFLICMGTLGDRVGRRRLLLIGGVAFGAASVLAALSTSATMLIVTRALLGIAASTLMPSTLSLIRNMFLDARQRSVAIGVWMTSFMVGALAGPLVGGALLGSFWWGSVFLLAVPVMVLLLIVGPLVLPEYRNEDAGRLDLPSALLSLLAVLSVVYGAKKTATDGLGPVPLAFLLAGLALGTVFVRRQRALSTPFLDLNLFRSRSFNTALTAMTLSTLMMMGINLLVAQYLQLVADLPPFKAGLWMMPMTVMAMIAVMISTTLVRTVRPAVIIAAGLAVSAVGFFMLTRLDSSSGVGMIVTASVVFAAGLSPAGVLSTDILVGSAPPERAGEASAIQETSTEFGGALGLALLGSVFNAAYQTEIGDRAPSAAPDAAVGDTLGGTLAAVEQYGETAWTGPLVDAARQSFTDAFHVTALVCVAIALVTAALVAVFLRQAPATGDVPSGDGEESGTPTAREAAVGPGAG
ncbi:MULTISPECIES: MFS transporter [Streptomyces]|uniref:MFS transporter n=2 Tax=Streptomyces griseiscabiei TaxID=2993540 RepID=A0ABU4LIX6_9ACTN|nr:MULTISPECIES: MFS transporter [Streptomyces]MBZ3907950.1 MFS transporter [Streptomyces griseiscabiei]MDX2915099.1 MFS transporter [Streptomyces griseiscabiei]